MEIQLPSGGCAIYYGTYLDHYQSGVRTRYYLNANKLVKSSTANYTSLPSGYSCLSQGDLKYQPELQVYFPLISAIIIVFAFHLLYKIILKRLLP